MRTTIEIDDALFEQALAATDPDQGQTDLWREVLTTFVRVQTAKRLAEFGGSMAQSQDIPRRSDI